MSKTSAYSKNKWIDKNCKRMQLLLPKELGARYAEKCAAEGLTMSDIPKRAIYAFMGEKLGNEDTAVIPEQRDMVEHITISIKPNKKSKQS